MLKGLKSGVNHIDPEGTTVRYGGTGMLPRTSTKSFSSTVRFEVQHCRSGDSLLLELSNMWWRLLTHST